VGLIGGAGAGAGFSGMAAGLESPLAKRHLENTLL
jgi:hypothetical protein